VHPMGGSESILLVEDEIAVRSLVQAVLSRAGYRIVAMPDGAEAAHWLKSGDQVDLLVTDVKMPGMNGQVLCEHARRLRPHLPVLFISGYSREMLTLASDRGQESMAFLTKPFTPQEILLKVRETLDSRQLTAAVASPARES